MIKPKKPTATTEDSDTFRTAMRDVAPHTHSKNPLYRKKLRSKKIQNSQEDQDNSQPIGFQFSDYDKLDNVDGEALLNFSRSGVQHKMLRKMRQGQYNIEATLDLHGKTTFEAREALSKFLLQCEQHKLRHVLVIHGKGKFSTIPVLKNKLNNWLRQTDQVIAFCTAAPKNGGSGALYVLLRGNKL